MNNPPNIAVTVGLCVDSMEDIRRRLEQREANARRRYPKAKFSMTVGDLATKLAALPPGLPVVLYDGEYNDHYGAEEVKQLEVDVADAEGQPVIGAGVVIL